VLVPWAAHRGQRLFHQHLLHLQSGADGERQQPLLRRADDLTERDRRLGRYRHLGCDRLAAARRLLLVALTDGGPLPRGVLGRSPETYQMAKAQAGDRHLKFYESRDNLGPRRLA
jgi:hypothetical protein